MWELAKEEYPPDKIDHFFYLIIYLTAFYGLLHLLTHLLNLCFNNKRYFKLSKEKQGEYRGQAAGPIHATSSVVCAVLTIWYVCPDGKTPFNDDHCFNTPRYLHIWALVNTCGYFVFDTINIMVLINTYTTYYKQMLGHHFISLTIFMGTLAFMNWTVVFGVMMLLIELSTTYICIRWLLYTHKQHRGICNSINATCIFFAFFFTRMIY